MQNNKIAILLNGPVSNDSRMIKITKTISKYIKVDLFCLKGLASDYDIFDKERVNLICLERDSGLLHKLTIHTCFYNEFKYYTNKVLETKQNYEFVYACDLPMLKPALELKKKINAKVIYDSHELYNEGLNQFFPNFKKSTFIKKTAMSISLRIMYFLGVRAENKMVQKVDHFITTSNSYKNYFEEKYKVSGIQKVMNCPPSQEHKQSVNYRELFNWTEKDFIVIYQGGMNPGRGLSLLISAIDNCPDNIKLVFLGFGPIEEKLKAQTKSLDLGNKVKFVSRVKPHELIGYSMGADLGVNLLEDFNLNKKLASTNKLFEYIHANIAILASDTPENEYVLNKYHLGFLVQNNLKDLTEKIITASKSDLSTFKKNGALASKEFNWENQEDVFKKIFL